MRHRERAALAALVALLLLILGTAISGSWVRVGGMDSRSYYEMIRGIADRGRPAIDNGPANAFPELAARWNLPTADGLVVGTYPPLYPYLLATAERLGGLSLVVQLTIVGLALLALGAFALGRELTRDPLAGAATAWLAVLGNPIAVHALKPHSFVLATTCITWAAFLALRSLREPGPSHESWRWAAGAGLTAGLGVTAHYLAFPMAAAIAVVVLWSLRRRGLPFVAGVAAPLIALALVNYSRFDSLNPLSYGPCIWRVCQGARQLQTAGEMLAHAWPVLVWLAATAALLWALRRRRRALLGVGIAALIALLVPSLLQERALAYARAAWGVVVSLGVLEFEPPYRTAAEGPGLFHGPFVVKSLLQTAPALALAPLARLPRLREKLLLLLPALALIAAVVLRANMPSEAVIGHSLLHVRYLVPAMPLLIALAVVTVRDLQIEARHALIGLQLAAPLAVWLASENGDSSLPRRIVLLVASLALTGATVAWIAAARTWPRAALSRFAAWPAVLLLAWGCAVNLGVDLRHEIRLAQAVEQHNERMARHLPERFGVIGWPLRLNPFLSLAGDRDIQYADLSELEDWHDAHRVVDHWLFEERPAYLLLPPWYREGSPWPHLRIEPLPGPDRLARVVPRSQSR